MRSCGSQWEHIHPMQHPQGIPRTVRASHPVPGAGSITTAHVAEITESSYRAPTPRGIHPCKYFPAINRETLRQGSPLCRAPSITHNLHPLLSLSKPFFSP